MQAESCICHALLWTDASAWSAWRITRPSRQQIRECMLCCAVRTSRQARQRREPPCPSAPCSSTGWQLTGQQQQQRQPTSPALRLPNCRLYRISYQWPWHRLCWRHQSPCRQAFPQNARPPCPCPILPVPSLLPHSILPASHVCKPAPQLSQAAGCQVKSKRMWHLHSRLPTPILQYQRSSWARLLCSLRSPPKHSPSGDTRAVLQSSPWMNTSSMSVESRIQDVSMCCLERSRLTQPAMCRPNLQHDIQRDAHEGSAPLSAVLAASLHCPILALYSSSSQLCLR